MLNLLQPSNLLRGYNLNPLHVTKTSTTSLDAFAALNALSVSPATFPEGSFRSNNLYNNYTVGEKLGRGATGKVYSIRCKFTQRSYACKVMHKGSVKREKIQREIHVLSKVHTNSHKNIVGFYECYENKRDVFLVMQLASGGELFSALKALGPFSPQTTAKIIKNVLLALEHLHNVHKIVHRDIKLENLLCVNDVKTNKTADVSEIILADFGLAVEFEKVTDRTYTVCGSQHYVAPEVLLMKGYSFSPDMWSLGVLSYMLLSDAPPFFESDDKTLFDAIVQADFPFHSSHGWNKNNDMLLAKDFINSLLVLNPESRLTATQALKHDFINLTKESCKASN